MMEGSLTQGIQPMSLSWIFHMDLILHV